MTQEDYETYINKLENQILSNRLEIENLYEILTQKDELIEQCFCLLREKQLVGSSCN